MKEEINIPDDILIHEYLEGNAGAFNMLYERYRRPLYAYLNRLIGNHASADDVFQQTWLKIIANFGKYENRQKFLAWAMMIAHNQTMDMFRKTASSAEAPLDEEFSESIPAPQNSEPWRDMHDSELAEALENALAGLPREQREVFLLRRDGISFKEIAQIQSCSLNTALARMTYALKNLKKQLENI